MSSVRTSRWGGLLLAIFLAFATDATGSVSSELLSLTGGQRTRLVWIRGDGQDWAVQWSDDWAHPFGPTSNPNNDIWKIMVFDTTEGSERELKSTLGAYCQPMITPGGTRVIWTHITASPQVMICDFDGGNERVLVSGIQQALGVADPGGVEYVYVAENNWQSVYRYRIDNTAVRELVWNSDRVSDLWSVLRDGSVAGMGWGLDRWCGLVNLPNGTPVPYNQGCNSAISPDGTHFMQCEPDHIGVFMFDVNADAGARNKRWVDMHNAPGMGGGGADMVWYPKWSDFDPQCFTISGSYYYLGNNPSTADIYFGKLNSGFTAVETWVRVTDNPICETQARSWIGNIGPTPSVISTSAPSVAYVGGAYTYAISVSGSPDPTVTVSGLPSWLTFDGSDTISGTPSASDAGTSPTITVTATNSEGSDTQVFSIEVYSLIAPEGNILREYWTGIGGGVVTDLTSNANYPDNPTGSDNPTSFSSPVGWGDSYGQRFRGYVYPPESGTYTFWIASDDASELWISTDESPSSASKIAWVTEWTNPQEWSKDANQHSGAITLQAGSRYYIEALHKEGAGGDHLAVGWQLPSGSYERPIPGLRLSPWGGQDPVPSITSAAVTEAMADMEYAYVIAANGIPTPTLSVSTLPDWLSFNGTDTLSGTPSGSDVGLTPTIIVTATNSEGTATQDFQIDVSPFVGEAPAITSTAPTTVVANSVYTYTVTASGRPAPTFLASGLPLWLTFDGTDTLSGTPTMSDVGVSPTITVTATNSEGSDTQTLNVTVAVDPNAPSITILSPAAGDVWYMGTTRRIEWTANNISEVIIFSSPDGGGLGASWVQIEGSGVSPGDSRWGSYPWTLGQELIGQITPSTNCVIKMATYQQEHPTLSGVFEVRAVSDTDGDGMDDGWELDYIGDMLQDGAGDFDGDGVLDLNEFMTGTDPTDPNDPAGRAAGESSSSGLSCAPGSKPSPAAPATAAALSILLLVLVRNARDRRRRVGVTVRR